MRPSGPAAAPQVLELAGAKRKPGGHLKPEAETRPRLGALKRPGPASGARPWRKQQARTGRGLALVLQGFVAFVLGAWGTEGVELRQYNEWFVPICNPIPEPPPKGYLRWSSPSTWLLLNQRPSGGVPGVGGGVGVNVTIPCGYAILLDTSITVNYLNIHGLLRVEDPWPVVKTIWVNAAFISVQGQLNVGTEDQHFRSKLIFNLQPNTKMKRAPLVVRGLSLPNKRTVVATESSALVGHKAMAVVGGAVNLYGMPGGGDTPSWVRLNANTFKGANVIQVDAAVSSTWPVGGTIAISSTDYDPKQSEQFNILKFGRAPNGKDLIYIDGHLQYNHFGNPLGLADGFGGFVDQRAEVALLSRNIVITSSNERWFGWEGGHFIVYMTKTPQVIHGVEFSNLGQLAQAARFPLNFHACGDSGGNTLVMKNSIHSSKQRCINIRATHNLTIQENVAYNTRGHCFVLEEGGEKNNTFTGNLGMLTLPAQHSITSDAWDSGKYPATFWITNMFNRFINNVAAGSMSSGVWTEMNSHVRGMSVYIPELHSLSPLVSSGGLITGFTIHSNWEYGFRAYPQGIRPKQTYQFSPSSPLKNAPDTSITLSRFNLYKHRRMGFYFQKSANVLITKCTLADNNVGIYMLANSGGSVLNNRFVGYTTNYGTPPALADCRGSMGPYMCAPIAGCKFPPTTSKNVRNIKLQNWLQPAFGILMFGIQYVRTTSPNGQVSNNRFSAYDPSCGRPAAAIGVGVGEGQDWWDASVGVMGVKVANSVPLVYFPTSAVTIYKPRPTTWMAQEAMLKDLVLRDKDGSLVGGTGGYVVADFPFLLPPRVAGSAWPCTALPNGNAYGCQGVCYRTLWIEYYEASFMPYPKERNATYRVKKHGDFSYLRIVRTSDEVLRETDGNLHAGFSNGGVKGKRLYYVTLLAGQVYDVYVQAPFSNPTFWPSSVRIQYADGWGKDEPCSGIPITLRLMPKGRTKQWSVVPSDLGFYSPCPGVTFFGQSKRWPFLYHYGCYNGARLFLLRLNSNLAPRTALRITSTNQPVARCGGTSPTCGVFPTGDYFYYDDSGKDFSARPGHVGFQSPLFDQSKWSYGPALLGRIQHVGPLVDTKTEFAGIGGKDGVQRTTFYFRRYFTVTPSACLAGLMLEYYPIHGLLVWLNGVELFRFSLPAGPVNGSTYATKASTYQPNASLVRSPVLNVVLQSAWRDHRIPYVKAGKNLIAYELHVHHKRDYSYYFDSRVSFHYKC